ncbi:MAG: ExbD/TolR family protein [Rhodospirillaceae bacterium]|nr:ExbD/TolR family protein [Rhodospirillaceae bacterium]
MSDINVTPMVDVMLVLLVIFMVTAPLMTTGVPLDLPQGGSQVLADANRSLRISVDEAGTVYLGTDPVDVTQLVGRVVEMRRANPELGVVISGDRVAAYGVVMGVMQALKEAGIEKVGLETGTGEAPKKDATRKTRKKP